MATPTVSSGDSSLTSQCLAFCQALASQGQAFTFSLSIGSSFTFSLDTRGKGAMAPVAKKKPSPSTLRRNARRREEFLKKKSPPSMETAEASAAPGDTDDKATEPSLQECLQCDESFKSAHTLRSHVRLKHSVIMQLDGANPDDSVCDSMKDESVNIERPICTYFRHNGRPWMCRDNPSSCM